MPAKPCAQLRSVEGIQYELVRKKVKQLHLRVRDNGTVMVSIPLTASLEQADRFVLQNAQWIRDTRVKNITKRNKDNADLPDKATAQAIVRMVSERFGAPSAGESDDDHLWNLGSVVVATRYEPTRQIMSLMYMIPAVYHLTRQD